MSIPFAYNNGGTGNRQPGTLQFGTLTVGGTGDAQTLQNSGLKFWNGPDMTSAPRIIAKTAPAGLQPNPVVEENVILDPNLSGAVGGSLPTGWTTSTIPEGISVTYSERSSLNGVFYFEITFSGERTSGQGPFQITTTATSPRPSAVPGALWTNRYYFEVLTDDIPPTSITERNQVNIRTFEYNSSNIIILENNFPVFVPKDEFKQFACSTVLSATTAFVASSFVFFLQAGVPVNFTLRVGGPVFGSSFKPASVGFNRAANQAQFFQMTAQLTGTTPSTDDQAVRLLNANNCWTNYNPAVTDGLILSLDAANEASYPKSGSDWWNLSRIQNTNKATLFGSPSFSSQNGGLLEFTGEGGNYAQSDKQNLVSSAGWTVEVWFKTTATLNNLFTSIVTTDLISGGISFFLGNQFTGSNTIDFGFYTSSSAYIAGGGITPTQGTFYQLVGTYTDAGGSVLALYSNSVLQGTSSGTFAPSLNSQVKIARDYSDDLNANLFCPVTIGIVRIYNRALSSGEITQNFIANRDRFGL